MLRLVFVVEASGSALPSSFNAPIYFWRRP